MISPQEKAFRRVAPLGTRDKQPCTWAGRSSQKPWHYQVTACIPHLDTVEPLGVVIDLLRCQTERPYVLVIDTGSPPDICQQLEQFRAEDVEIHYIRGHGYIHSSAPVTTALDLGFALCRSPYLYNTHSDVFVKRRDFLAWLVSQCSEKLPVIGYEMSPRDWVTDDWRGIPSHTATIYHMRTMRRHGLIWSMEHAYELTGWEGKNCNGWPDTETGFGLQLRQKGIPVKLLGPERNHQVDEDENMCHSRSHSGTKAYNGGEVAKAAEDRCRVALAEARQRVARWQRGES